MKSMDLIEMPKKSKLKTPDWILEGYDSEEEYNKKKGIKKEKKYEKTYKMKKCPKCGSSEVSVVLVGEEGKKADTWECKACKWRGKNIEEVELNEEEFLAHLEKMDGK